MIHRLKTNTRRCGHGQPLGFAPALVLLIVLTLPGCGENDPGGINPDLAPPTGDQGTDLARDQSSAERGPDLAPPADQSPPADTAPGPDTKSAYHPAGYKAAKVHGLAAKQQKEDCRTCHGADLLGGSSSVSCDSCHKKGWRTNCVYCHGGYDNLTGAPPDDLDNALSPAALNFPPHTVHVVPGNNAPFDCKHCHLKPTKALDKGHFLDTTPGKAEVDLTKGLSASGKYSSGTCSSLYCHGNGRGHNGTLKSTAAKRTCGSCHPYTSSGSTAWASMSGDHGKHLGKKMVCSDCHSSVDKNGKITTLSLHINGKVETPKLYNASGKNCTGLCHSMLHFFHGW